MFPHAISNHLMKLHLVRQKLTMVLLGEINNSFVFEPTNYPCCNKIGEVWFENNNGQILKTAHSVF